MAATISQAEVVDLDLRLTEKLGNRWVFLPLLRVVDLEDHLGGILEYPAPKVKISHLMNHLFLEI